MRLTFLGTRDEIARRHRMHSSLLVACANRNVMIACGVDWSSRIMNLRPDAFLTHGNPDHAGGLRNGAPCEVFATEETWRILKNFAVRERRVIVPRKAFRIGGVMFEAFPVEHSILAPAVGYRVSCRRSAIFYAPNVACIHQESRALSGFVIYVGDGATITRPLLRRRGNTLIGHAPINSQLKWCKRQGVPRAVFTHCGSQIVRGDERVLAVEVRSLGRALGVEALIAYDRLKINL
jgi:phosphoribosyl 1,2-cyclic phosphodiesterase